MSKSSKSSESTISLSPPTSPRCQLLPPPGGNPFLKTSEASGRNATTSSCRSERGGGTSRPSTSIYFSHAVGRASGLSENGHLENSDIVFRQGAATGVEPEGATTRCMYSKPYAPYSLFAATIAALSPTKPSATSSRR